VGPHHNPLQQYQDSPGRQRQQRDGYGNSRLVPVSLGALGDGKYLAGREDDHPVEPESPLMAVGAPGPEAPGRLPLDAACLLFGTSARSCWNRYPKSEGEVVANKVNRAFLAKGKNPEKLMRKPAAAEYLDTTERFIERLVAERRIAYYKIGKFVRFTKEDLDAFAESGKIEPVR